MIKGSIALMEYGLAVPTDSTAKGMPDIEAVDPSKAEPILLIKSSMSQPNQ